jgi:hypothetical protein
VRTRTRNGIVSLKAAASCHELALPRHPRLADFDVGDRIRAHLVGIAFKYREIRFLALFKRAEAVAPPNLACSVDRHGADCVVKRNGLIGPDHGIVDDTAACHRRADEDELVGRSIVLSPLVGPLEFGSLEHLKFISDLPPLIDEVQIHYADCVILARKRTMVTLHCLLSTVFDPANHPSQHRLLRYVPLLNAHVVPSLNFRLMH